MKTNVLLACGAIAGLLFTVAWIVEGATRANYDSLRHPISSLSIGEFGWTQAATSIVTGLLMLAFALGLRHALPVRGGSIGAVALRCRVFKVELRGSSSGSSVRSLAPSPSE